MTATLHAASRPSVAVVDDDPTCTMLVERVLANAGYAVAVYTSGEALLDSLAARPPAVICLDLSLPGIDGLETLRRLKQIAPTLPVIVFSASAGEISARATAGAFACVPKTAAWEELREKVGKALGEGRT